MGLGGLGTIPTCTAMKMNKYRDTENFIDGLLLILDETENYLFESFVQEGVVLIDKQQKDKLFNFEVKIYSLWLIVLVVSNQKILDIFHEKLCKEYNLNETQRAEFLGELDKRYGQYFSAYTAMVKNGSPIYFGEVMYDIFIKKTEDFSYSDPIVKAKLVIIFKGAFKAVVKSVSILKKSIEINDGF